MSDTTTTPEATESTEVDFDNLPDSRIEGDAQSFRAMIAEHITRVKNGASAATRLTNAAKLVAASRVMLRAHLIRENGYPDWSADSDSYRLLVSDAENRALANLSSDAKSKLTASVRQHVKRTFLLIGIVDYCITHHDPAKGDKYQPVVDRWGKSLDMVNLTSEQIAVLTDPPQVLLTDVRRHYKVSKLTLPDGPFAYDQATSSTNPVDPTDPENVVQTVVDGVSGLADIVPALGSKQCLRGVSILAERIMAGGEIPDRADVVEDMQRIAKVSLFAAKVAEGKSSSEDMDTLKGLLYDPKKDAAK